MAGKKPIVKLRVFRGTELNYDANGNVKNENHLVALQHASNNWVNFLKNLKLNGYVQVNVESAWDEVAPMQYSEIKDLSKFKNEVDLAFQGAIQVNITPEQKRIAELEAKLERLLNANTIEKALEGKKEVVIDEKDAVIAEYVKKVGKKPFNGWDIETIKQKQVEHLAK